jgi:hypothetical protein
MEMILHDQSSYRRRTIAVPQPVIYRPPRVQNLAIVLQESLFGWHLIERGALDK